MAINFTAADVKIESTRTLAYTCPGGKVGIVFSGVIPNVDSVIKQDRFLTVEVQKLDLSYISIFKDIPVPYGNSLALPKIVLTPGEKLYLTADASNVLQSRISIAERS